MMINPVNDNPATDDRGLAEQPVELAARQEDAAVTASGAPARAELLNVYRLQPIAEAHDPRWDNSPFQGTVVVAARTAGDARIVASGRELDYMEIDAKPADDVTTTTASAFRSEKLYTVIEIDRDRSDLRRGILEGNIAVDTTRPVQV
jgi:hypothetical protein